MIIKGKKIPCTGVEGRTIPLLAGHTAQKLGAKCQNLEKVNKLQTKPSVKCLYLEWGTSTKKVKKSLKNSFAKGTPTMLSFRTTPVGFVSGGVLTKTEKVQMVE